MTLQNLIQNATSTLKEHSPTVLAALGVAGVVSTAFLAHKAGREYATTILVEEADHEWEKVSGKRKFELTWARHIPMIVVGGATIACVITATSIGNRRTALAMSAVTLGEQAFREYRDKAVEVVGKPKAKKIVDEIAQDKVTEAGASEVIFVGNDNILCFDTLTGRYFESSKTEIEKASVEINRMILNEMSASQNDWYQKLGLGRVGDGDNVGWNNDRPLEVEYSAVLQDDKPVLALSYKFPPIIKFSKIW